MQKKRLSCLFDLSPFTFVLFFFFFFQLFLHFFFYPLFYLFIYFYVYFFVLFSSVFKQKNEQNGAFSYSLPLFHFLFLFSGSRYLCHKLVHACNRYGNGLEKELIHTNKYFSTLSPMLALRSSLQASNAIRDVVSGERLRFRSRESSGEEGSRGEGAGAEGSEM